MFSADDWKWHDGYDIVEGFHKLWEQMKGLDGISGYFCRVGENHGDVEEMEFGDDPNYEFFRPYSYLQLDDTIIGEFEVEKEKVKAEPLYKTEEPSSSGFL